LRRADVVRRMYDTGVEVEHTRMNLSSKAVRFITLIVVLMDYAALDDITTGHESNFLLEYLFLGLSAIWFALIIFPKLTRRRS
jgi:hypothetical protein